MGEGGAIVINNSEYNERAEILREKGTNRAKFFRGQVDKYTWVDYGSSYLPSDLNAAYLWAQLEKADEINNDRLKLWDYYYDNLKELEEKGVKVKYITLHVGIGTFRPVKTENITEHQMHSEWFEIPQDTAEEITKAKAEGRRIISVGTTSTRTLESCYKAFGCVKACSMDTNIFIYPGFKFGVIDGLITNFHLPESTLIMLVSAFAGYENTMSAYKHAVEEKYRFYSFGDAMFIY